MYLIHAALRAPSTGIQLPCETGELVRRITDVHNPVEHVSVHPYAQPDPVLGVYLLAASLAEAEERVWTLACRAVAELPSLRGWTVARVGAPFVAPYYERLLLSSSVPAGRIGPGPIPSS